MKIVKTAQRVATKSNVAQTTQRVQHLIVESRSVSGPGLQLTHHTLSLAGYYDDKQANLT